MSYYATSSHIRGSGVAHSVKPRSSGRAESRALAVAGGLALTPRWLPDGVRTRRFLCLSESATHSIYFVKVFEMQHEHFVYNFHKQLSWEICGTSVMTPFVLTPSGSCQMIQW